MPLPALPALGLLLRKPKVLGGVIVLVAIGGLWFYHKAIVNERDDLRAEKIALEADLATSRANQKVLEGALATEREAAATAAAERDAARRTIDEFRAARRDDPEAIEWAAQPVPSGERERLCVALPEMEGCQPELP